MMDKRLYIPALMVFAILIGHYFMVSRPCCFDLIRRTFNTLTNGYVAGTHSVVFITVPTTDVAKTIAQGAVSKGLAACVNIIPSVTSIYLWEGKIEEDQEYYMLIKTATEKVPELTKYVRENHPYDVPQVVSVLISGGNSDYLDWISNTVLGKQALVPDNDKTDHGG